MKIWYKILFLGLALLYSIPGFCQWLDSGSPYRIKITSQSTQVDATISDYVYYFAGSDLPSDFWNNVVGAGDVIVSEGENSRVPAYVVAFVDNGSSGTFSLFFKGTSNPSSNKDYYIYFGSGASVPTASSDFGRDNVFSDIYMGWMMSESASTSADHYQDITGNGNNGTRAGTPGSNSTSGNAIEMDATYFTGGTDYIDIDNNETWLAPFTSLLWLRRTNTSDTGDMGLRKLSGGPTSNATDHYTSCAGSGEIDIQKDYGASTEVQTASGMDVEDNDWHFFSAAFDANFDVGDIGIDGSFEAINFSNNGVESQTYPFQIGHGGSFDMEYETQLILLANSDFGESKITTYHSNQSDVDSFWAVDTYEVQPEIIFALGLSGSVQPLGLSGTINALSTGKAVN